MIVKFAVIRGTLHKEEKMNYKLVNGKCNYKETHITMCEICGGKPSTILVASSVTYPFFGRKVVQVMCKNCYLKFKQGKMAL